jgi:H+/Na+-translocating ferredoxin:NAD+ oxidoreductase subunit C
LNTFKLGGVHPPEEKDLSREAQIERFEIPKRVVLPMSQHLGAPCEPLVKKGEIVKCGQKIADSDKAVSAPVHASISGKVKSIEHLNHPLGPRVMSVVIEGDGSDDWVEGINPANFDKDAPLDVDFSKVKEFKKKIREAGIVGLGGAAFPTHIKLSPPPDKKIDTLILNGAECEPFLTSDHRMMLERPKSIMIGIRIIMEILGVKKAYIAIEANKPDAIEIMQSNCLEGISVVPCKTKYPEGGEKQMIFAVTGREVPNGKLPMEVGCVVQNVGTAAAIYEAIALNKPLIERVVTVTGSAISTPKNLLTRMGTPFKELLDFCGFNHSNGSKVIMGGPMMGKAQKYLDVPVVKGTSGILCVSPEDIVPMDHRPCLRCGQCVEVCPMGLNPTQIAMMAESRDYENLIKEGIMDCMECGSCAYICPSRRQMVHFIRVGKMEARR